MFSYHQDPTTVTNRDSVGNNHEALVNNSSNQRNPSTTTTLSDPRSDSEMLYYPQEPSPVTGNIIESATDNIPAIVRGAKSMSIIPAIVRRASSIYTRI